MTKLTFEQWIKEVDKHLVKLCFMTHEDLPDWTYRDAYDDGYTPLEAAKEALRNAQDN